jgi:vesicle coat complex subunit
MSYSETQLTALAKNNPKELIRIITSPNSDVHALTFGAEILGGEVADESLVLPALRQLLKHVNAVVREGAMIGVSAFYMEKKPPQDVLDRLKKMSTDDPSPACKDLANSLLEDYNK